MAKKKRDESLIYTWRNKFLTLDAQSIGDMAATLEGAAKQLREMEAAGFVLQDDGGTENDYANLLAPDASTLARFVGPSTESPL